MNIDLLQATLQALSTATNGILQLMQGGTLVIGTVQDYPPNATAVTASSGNAANAAATAAFTASTTKLIWITGFDIGSAGATAAKAVTVTLTGVVNGPLVFTYATLAGASTLNAPLSIRFPAPIPATAVGTAVAVSLPALGTGNTNASVTAYGYLL